jgi:hypothetical protein
MGRQPEGKNGGLGLDEKQNETNCYFRGQPLNIKLFDFLLMLK